MGVSDYKLLVVMVCSHRTELFPSRLSAKFVKCNQILGQVADQICEAKFHLKLSDRNGLHGYVWKLYSPFFLQVLKCEHAAKPATIVTISRRSILTSPLISK